MKSISKEQVNLNPKDSKLLDEYKRQLVSLTPHQFQVALGVMLGDGSLQSQDNGKTYRLKFEQGDNHRDYIHHLYDVFSDWSLTPPKRQERRNKKGNLVITWTFQTLSHVALSPLAEIFFLRKDTVTGRWRKGIGEDFVEKHMTTVVLAYWFMDDGGKMDYGKNSGKGIVFNTHGFEEREVELLSSGLRVKYDLDCWVKRNKNKPIVAISGRDYERVLALIENLVIPSLRDKFPSPRRGRRKKADDIV